MDTAGETFIDASKVKPASFQSGYYKVGSRKFSGRNAEVVLAGNGTPADMKQYRAKSVPRFALRYEGRHS